MPIPWLDGVGGGASIIARLLFSWIRGGMATVIDRGNRVSLPDGGS